MNKENQIKELANMLSEGCGNCDICEFCGKGNNDVDCIAYYDANKIYNAGYRKLPKDSVVLSREEWKQIKNSLYYSKKELERKLQKERKETAEKIFREIDERFCFFTDGKQSEEYEKGFGNGVLAVGKMITELALKNGVDIKE